MTLRSIALAATTAVTLWSSSAASQPSPSATQPTTGPSSGTTPGNSGSTGWTGGTGGSHTGTSPHAPTPGSPNAHPPTATGLDPTKDGKKP